MRGFFRGFFKLGIHAFPEVFRQVTQGLLTFRSVRAHVHVPRVDGSHGQQVFLAMLTLYPFIPGFFIGGVPVRIKGDVGIPVFDVMGYKSRLRHLLEVIGTGDRRHADKQHKHHHGKQGQETAHLHHQSSI